MSPKSVELKAARPKKVMVNGEEREKISHYNPRRLRCSGMKAAEKNTLSRIIDVRRTSVSDPIHTSLVELLLYFFNLSRTGGLDAAKGICPSTVYF